MLKKLAATFFLLGCLALHARPASATTCTAFYTWITGDTITAARLNGNTNNLVTCGNAIDFNNIGSSGIKPSNIKGANTTDNTFGLTTAAATINVPLLFGANAISMSAVGINNDNAGTNGMLLDVPTGSTNGFQFQVNASTVFQITNAGALATNVTLNKDLIFAASATVSATSVAIWNDNAGTNGMILNVPTGSTNGFQFEVNNVAKASISAAGKGTFVGLTAGTGTVQGASDGSTTTFIPPVYNAGGTALTSTAHMVVGTIAPTMNGNCNADSNCSLNSNSTTLVGAAIFSGGPDADFKCTFSNASAVGTNGSLVTLGFDIAGSSASNVQVWAKNFSASTIASGQGVQVDFVCVGF